MVDVEDALNEMKIKYLKMKFRQAPHLNELLKKFETHSDLETAVKLDLEYNDILESQKNFENALYYFEELFRKYRLNR